MAPEPWPTSSETAPCSSRREARSRKCPSLRPRLTSTYINNQVGDAPITNPFSLPFHQDNGLFLMLTPSDKLPVVLKDSQGRPVFTDRLGSDAVMFLVGRGLTDWLLQDAEHGIFPPPHAVPSLAGTAITDRTVMARMKIAEYNPLPMPSPPSPELPSPTGPSWPG